MANDDALARSNKVAGLIMKAQEDFISKHQNIPVSALIGKYLWNALQWHSKQAEADTGHVRAFEMELECCDLDPEIVRLTDDQGVVEYFSGDLFSRESQAAS